jgi:hypothetical protein
MAVERVIDLEHQRYADIPSTNEGVPGRGAEDQRRARRRAAALARMQSRARAGDAMAVDILILLGGDG